MIGGMFGTKGARVGNEVDMYVGQLKSDVMNLKMTLKQSDMIESQFNQFAELAKMSGDAQMCMMFDNIRQQMDTMQNNALMIASQMEQKLQMIDNATDKIQNF